MRWRIFLLRVRGKKRTWPEAANDFPLIGDVSMYYMGRKANYKVAKLVCDRGEFLLYQPEIVSFMSDRIRLRGFEHLIDGEETYTVLQEWLCEAERGS